MTTSLENINVSWVVASTSSALHAFIKKIFLHVSRHRFAVGFPIRPMLGITVLLLALFWVFSDTNSPKSIGYNLVIRFC